MEKSSFFNSVNGDRKYKAENFADYFNSLLTNGVFPGADNLQVITNSNMSVAIKKGKAWINGYCYFNTDNLNHSIDPADGVLDRIDRVVLRLDFLNREIKSYIRKGIYGSSPVAPSPQRTADMYEIVLADIKIKHGIININQADITDMRFNENYCGIVSSLLQVNTEYLFAQYNAEFHKWFTDLQSAIDGDVAGNLFNKIQENKRAINDINVHSTIVNAVDEYGVKIDISKKRRNGTLMERAVLSGGTPPKYTTRTITLYNEDGITIADTATLKITYDVNNVPSEVIQ